MKNTKKLPKKHKKNRAGSRLQSKPDYWRGFSTNMQFESFQKVIMVVKVSNKNNEKSPKHLLEAAFRPFSLDVSSSQSLLSSPTPKLVKYWAKWPKSCQTLLQGLIVSVHLRQIGTRPSWAEKARRHDIRCQQPNNFNVGTGQGSG